MKIKVCGIRKQSNLAFLNESDVDFVGFIFYPKSARNFEEGDIEKSIQSSKKKVGVFVNESVDRIIQMTEKYELDYLQLHGDESPEYCLKLKQSGFKLFKAFPIYKALPDDLKLYESIVDYFLFDTKGVSYGGNGTQFDWGVLNQYNLKTPFILSGGIGPEDVQVIKQMKHPKLFAIDVNSRFENAPGEKNEELLKEFIEELKK